MYGYTASGGAAQGTQAGYQPWTQSTAATAQWPQNQTPQPQPQAAAAAATAAATTDSNSAATAAAWTQAWAQYAQQQWQGYQTQSAAPAGAAAWSSYPQQMAPTESLETFQRQFDEWESNYNKWLDENRNHPDRDAYNAFVQQASTLRQTLLQRKEQLKAQHAAAAQAAAAAAATPQWPPLHAPPVPPTLNGMQQQQQQQSQQQQQQPPQAQWGAQGGQQVSPWAAQQSAYPPQDNTGAYQPPEKQQQPWQQRLNDDNKGRPWNQRDSTGNGPARERSPNRFPGGRDGDRRFDSRPDGRFDRDGDRRLGPRGGGGGLNNRGDRNGFRFDGGGSRFSDKDRPPRFDERGPGTGDRERDRGDDDRFGRRDDRERGGVRRSRFTDADDDRSGNANKEPLGRPAGAGRNDGQPEAPLGLQEKMLAMAGMQPSSISSRGGPRGGFSGPFGGSGGPGGPPGPGGRGGGFGGMRRPNDDMDGGPGEAKKSRFDDFDDRKGPWDGPPRGRGGPPPMGRGGMMRGGPGMMGRGGDLDGPMRGGMMGRGGMPPGDGPPGRGGPPMRGGPFGMRGRGGGPGGPNGDGPMPFDGGFRGRGGPPNFMRGRGGRGGGPMGGSGGPNDDFGGPPSFMDGPMPPWMNGPPGFSDGPPMRGGRGGMRGMGPGRGGPPGMMMMRGGMRGGRGGPPFRGRGRGGGPPGGGGGPGPAGPPGADARKEESNSPDEESAAIFEYGHPRDDDHRTITPAFHTEDSPPYTYERPPLKSRSLFSRRRSLSPQPERRAPTSQSNRIPDKPLIRSAAEIFLHPGRVTRPAKTAIVLRGLPGSGKSRLAKLMKDLEAKHGSGELRVLSIDDYFLVESDIAVETPTGKKCQKGMKYEYDAEMEASYQAALVKSFVKQLEARHFDVLVVDAPNPKLSELTKFVKAASEHSYVPFVMETSVDDPALCFERNVHSRELEDIQKIKAEWEELTGAFTLLDPAALFKDEDDIQEVEMDDAQQDDDREHLSALSGDSNAEESCDGEVILAPSKWEKMEKTEEKLSRLDGIKKRSAVMKMDEFLTVTDDYESRGASEKKRVRWADIEERKRIDRARAIGFVVGQTDWNAFTDPETQESSALTQTKYF